ncbi:MAG: aromatic ring-hydroxylating dioxygenase subunit alpha [Archangium gephyra]|uniref:Aromatic ring-hydroxylating dioxygenase subunit alpha n=1 Tax=Archangium gephyra TaxID=48 RepID=A0A2W5VSJ0_9BACT|nr:MAG: aromatic ring-hydroxylating dioxygenase subunit alpha [Archangium gephyra]
MFDGFAKVWTPVILATSLRRGRPLPVVLAGEKLVFFRGSNGQAHALVDRCPHRGVSLSLGTVTSDGCLECPFHAWKFDGSGAVTHVPLNPDAKRERLFARAIPVREIGGVLWAWTEVTATPPSEPIVPEALTLPGLARTYFQVEWNAHWSRAMENMLDSPHVPFVHKSTIGRFMRPYLRPDSRMDVNWEDTPWGGTTRSMLDDREDSGADLHFYRPNMMALNIPVPKQVFRMHAFCVPIDASRTRMIIVGARSFATWRVLNPLFNWSNKRIAAEDRAIVESSWPVEVPPPSEETSVRTDRATLQFRKYYYAQLKPPAPEQTRAA